MPPFEEKFAVRDDDPSEAFDFAAIVSLEIPDAHGREPERCDAVARTNVDMRWLMTGAVLLAEEVEPVRPESMDGRHAHLAARIGGVMSMTIDPYLMVIR